MKELLFSSPRVHTGSGAYPAFYPLGTGFSSPGIKRPGHETDHSPSSIADNNAWNYTSIPPIRLRGMVLR